MTWCWNTTKRLWPDVPVCGSCEGRLDVHLVPATQLVTLEVSPHNTTRIDTDGERGSFPPRWRQHRKKSERAHATKPLQHGSNSCSDWWHSLVGAIGTAQANPCCWLTPTVSSLNSCQALTSKMDVHLQRVEGKAMVLTTALCCTPAGDLPNQTKPRDKVAHALLSWTLKDTRQK